MGTLPRYAPLSLNKRLSGHGMTAPRGGKLEGHLFTLICLCIRLKISHFLAPLKQQPQTIIFVTISVDIYEIGTKSGKICFNSVTYTTMFFKYKFKWRNLLIVKSERVKSVHNWKLLLNVKFADIIVHLHLFIILEIQR
jgi:hypothetical protein